MHLKNLTVTKSAAKVVIFFHIRKHTRDFLGVFCCKRHKPDTKKIWGQAVERMNEQYGLSIEAACKGTEIK